MTTRKMIMVIFILFSIPSYGGEYVDDLVKQKEVLSVVLSKHDGLGIYTQSELEMELSFIDRFLYMNNASKEVELLRDAGSEFLKFLENNEVAYQQLSIDEWFMVVDLLFEIDNLISQKVAWGNLVVKMAICNKIFYWMLEYVVNYKGSVDVDTLDKIIFINKELRKHYPSNLSMFYIAMRYYNREPDFNIHSYVMSNPYYEELGKLQNLMDDYFNSEPDSLKIAKHFFEKEEGLITGSFIGLYNNPIPWSTFYRINYFSDSWDFHEYLLLVKKDPGVMSTKDISKDLVHEFLVNEYAGEGRFWMPYTAVNVVKKPEVYLDTYMLQYKHESLVRTVIRDRKSAKQKKSLKSDKMTAAKLW